MKYTKACGLSAGNDAPRQDGKTVIFDEDISVMTLADSSSVFREVIGV